MTDDRCAHRPMLASVALISTALIAYEIVLMRRLLIEHWHHFGYLVIGAALLGFGASGTLLAILERPARRHRDTALWLSAVGFTVALVLLPRAAATLPVTARFIPEDLWRQIGWWSLYWLAAGVPFLLGAAHIGTAIMTAGPGVGAVYGVNLFGSGVGAVVGGLLVARMPIENAYWPSIGLGIIAVGIFVAALRGATPTAGGRLRLAVTATVTVGVVIVERVQPPELKSDEFKYSAYVQRLAEQGSAKRIGRAADPHGYIEVYESPLFHNLPFLAISEPPPPMLGLVINGDFAGSAFCIDAASQASVMDTTLMAFPYRVVAPTSAARGRGPLPMLIATQPRVLLIGETGGTNVWLGRRRNAKRITVVQPNAALVRLLRGPLAERTGHVLTGADLDVVVDDPRAHLASNQAGSFDLIQIASLEGLGVGAPGMRGLAEDHLVTVEGIAACLHHLASAGAVSVCRGIQEPARENIRILATFAEALESIGVEHPDRHIVQVRDYLGVCTLALRSPLDEQVRTRLIEAIHDFNLTPVWYDGLPPADVNQPDQLAGPPGTNIDWLHHAAREIFSPRREAFYRTWLTNVRPPRDDRPFFWDFYKPGAVAVLRHVYQDLWLTRAELGRLFLYASLVLAGLVAILLILAPLAVVRLVQRLPRAHHEVERSSPPTLSMILYFGAIGVGFMGIEMALISRAIHWLGDPVIASALIIGSLLVLSGLGSLSSAGLFSRRLWSPATLVAGLTAIIAVLAFACHHSADIAAVASPAIAIVAVPLAFVMGAPMPRGITKLAERSPGLVPWAWGVNGVASVIGTSLAMVVAMSVGYRYVFGLAGVLYALAALTAIALGSVRARR